MPSLLVSSTAHFGHGREALDQMLEKNGKLSARLREDSESSEHQSRDHSEVGTAMESLYWPTAANEGDYWGGVAKFVDHCNNAWAHMLYLQHTRSTGTETCLSKVGQRFPCLGKTPAPHLACTQRLRLLEEYIKSLALQFTCNYSSVEYDFRGIFFKACRHTLDSAINLTSQSLHYTY